MAFTPELRSHSNKVCTLYKQALRNIEGYYVIRPVVRYHQVLLRKKFDDNKCIQDPKEQRRLLWLGEHELFLTQPPIPFKKFAKSAGGVAYEREVQPPDWVLDYWHPLEKKRYPNYFACREIRKCEYIQLWQTDTLY